MTNIIRRTGLVAAVAIAAAALWASPAAAHVTVNPKEAPQGGFAKLTFRVPNEKDDVATTKLEVAFPADSPIANVSVKPTAGWKATATKDKLATPVTVHGEEINEAVSRVVWTATSPDTGVKPGEFQEFDVSVGPLPEKDSIIFKALQTYADGEVVRWIEEPKGNAELDKPAPVLTLTKSGGSHGGAAPSTSNAAGRSAGHSQEEGSSTNGLAIAGLLAGLAGLGLGGFALSRTRRP